MDGMFYKKKYKREVEKNKVAGRMAQLSDLNSMQENMTQDTKARSTRI